MAFHKTDGPRPPKIRDRKRAVPLDADGAPVEKAPPGPGPIAMRSMREGLYSPALFQALSIDMNRRAYHAREGDPAEAEEAAE